MKELFSSKLVLILTVLMLLSWITLGIVYFTDFWLDWLPAKTKNVPEIKLKVVAQPSLSPFPTKALRAFQADFSKDEWLLYENHQYGYSFSYPPHFKVSTEGQVASDTLDKVSLLATVLKEQRVIISFEVIEKQLDKMLSDLLESKDGPRLTPRDRTVSGRRSVFLLSPHPALLPMHFLFDLGSGNTLKVVAVPEQDVDYHLIELQIIDSINLK